MKGDFFTHHYIGNSHPYRLIWGIWSRQETLEALNKLPVLLEKQGVPIFVALKDRSVTSEEVEAFYTSLEAVSSVVLAASAAKKVGGNKSTVR